MKKIAIVSMMMFGSLTAFAGDPAKPAAPADSMKKAPPAAMEMPKAPQQIADRAKAQSGTWKCDGTAMGMDGKDAKFTGTMTTKSDLDGFWIHDSFSGTMPGNMKFKFESFSTFDATSKKWHTTMMDNWGGLASGTADEMKDGKMETASDAVGPMGKSMMKDHLDVSDAKKGAHMWGEGSRDGGKTWMKAYDMSCKK